MKVWKEKYWQYRLEKTSPKEITIEAAIKESVNLGLISKFIQVIGEGKEALVLWGLDDKGRSVAVKIFKLYNSSHRTTLCQTSRYYRYELLEYFAKIEYSKHVYFHRREIPVPKPIKAIGFGYTMELIKYNNAPAKCLAELPKSMIDDPESLLEQSIDILQGIFIINYIHGDFSPYNLLVDDEGKVLCIDFLQAKPYVKKGAKTHGTRFLSYDEALIVLKKDITTLLAYFSRVFRLEVSQDEVFEYIVEKR